MPNTNYIGKYQIEARLGSGAFGQVHHGQDTVLNRHVAIKSLKKKYLNKHGQEPLINEAKALARLSHPNIVTLYELLETDDANHLVMEYVNGISLSERLKAGPFSLDEFLTIADKIICALSAAHEKGIVHGDIKPNNIVLDQAGIPYLVDFGLSKFSNRDDELQTLTSTEESSSSLEGTLPYMAPETIMGETINPRSDIFSVGVVFYEMLTGKNPFDAPNQGAILNKIINIDPIPLKQIRSEMPAWLADLINAMLDKSPTTRIASSSFVKAHLTSRGKQSLTSRLIMYSHHCIRLMRKKRTIPQWLKLAASIGAATLLFWASTIISHDVSPPISMRMEKGIYLVKHFEKKDAVVEAKKIFASILAENPEHSAARAGQALALIREYTSIESDPATLRRATMLAQGVYQQSPQLALAIIAHAWAQEFNGDLNTANALYEAAQKFEPGHPLILEGWARVHKKQGNFDKATNLLVKAIDLYPNDRIFYDDYGDILSSQGKFADAENILKKGITLNPDNFYGYANLAHVQHMQNRTRQAVSTIQDGLNIKKNASLYNNLGNYLFFLGDYEQSAMAFERTLEFEGNVHNYFFWANLADAYRWAAGKQKKAVIAYERALQLLDEEIDQLPNNATLNSRAALYAAKAQHNDRSRKALDIALKLPIKDPRVYYRAAVTYEILGDRKSALTFLKDAINAGYAQVEIKNDPELAQLRQDIEYHKLFTKTGGQ